MKKPTHSLKDWILYMADNLLEESEMTYDSDEIGCRNRAYAANVLYDIYDGYFPRQRQRIWTALSGGITETSDTLSLTSLHP